MGQSHGSSSAAPTSQAEARSHAPSSNDTNNASSKQLPSLATNINRRKSDFRENRRTDSIGFKVLNIVNSQRCFYFRAFKDRYGRQIINKPNYRSYI